MKELLSDPAILAAAAAFAGAVLPSVAKYIFEKLKGKAAKTDTKLDDQIVEVLEKLADKIIAEKATKS